MSTRSVLITTLFVLFALITSAFAAEKNASTLSKENIETIKIFSNDQDRIQFYLTDKKQKKYRIKNLTQEDAEHILKVFENQERIVLETEPNKRGYLDVLTWKKVKNKSH